ncbi:MAG: tyrosine-type recombinase/integrase [Firmicutes bacterium]|nr:tyrosine-type recombinase/integrase [Bacillota bacterium]
MLDFDLQVERFIASLSINKSLNTAKAYRSDLRLLKLHLVLARCPCVTLPHSKIAYSEFEAAFEADNQRLTAVSSRLLDGFTVDLEAIRPDDLVGYFLFLKETQGYAQTTINRKIVAVRRFFKYLFDRELLPDPFLIYDLETKTIHRNEAPLHLTAEEAFHFLATVQRHGCERDYTVFLIMLSMGLRIGEVVQMNIDDIGPETTFYRVTGGKGGKNRPIPVPPAVREAVAEYKKVRPRGKAKGQHRLALFLGNRYTRITPRAIQQKLKEYVALTDLPDSKKLMLTPHKLRHTFATALYLNGEDLRTLMRLLGHENIATTTIYTHVDDEKLLASLDKNPFAT